MRVKYLFLIVPILFSFGQVTKTFAADEDIIKYRQNLMKSLGAHASAIGAISQQKVTFTDNLAYHTDAIIAISEAAQIAFEPNVVGGTSSESIWDNWDDFKQRFAGLASSAREVSSLARSGGMAAAGPKMRGLFVCKSCHDTYRVEK